MPPVVSLIGKPNCGKTTLLERLIPALRRRGLQVGTIKHHVHAFEMDRPGKDSWRHKQAGARIVALSSPNGVGIIRDTDRDAEPTELVDRYFDGVDLVITEGYKDAATPKIEVFRGTVHSMPLPDDHPGLIASVSDVPIHHPLPCFSFNDHDRLADFLIATLLSPPRAASAAPPTIVLTVNGEALPLDAEATRMLNRIVTGMIAGATEDAQADLMLSVKPRGTADGSNDAS